MGLRDRPPTRNAQPGGLAHSLKTVQLAIADNAGFDIPPLTRYVIGIAGLGGIVLLIVGCLVGGKEDTIELDKVIHFTGYATLSFILVLAFRPVFFVPALFGLAAMGMGIEFLQTQTGRSFDWWDEVANIFGVCVGGFAGMLARIVYGFIRKELATLDARRRLIRFAPGSIILEQGSRNRQFFVIKKGEVRLIRRVRGTDEEVELDTLGPGEAIGVLGVIQHRPQYATVQATTPTTLYAMNLTELTDDLGGRQHPVSLILHLLADRVRELSEVVARAKLEDQPGQERSV